jgi:hypothetical protein
MGASLVEAGHSSPGEMVAKAVGAGWSRPRPWVAALWRRARQSLARSRGARPIRALRNPALTLAAGPRQAAVETSLRRQRRRRRRTSPAERHLSRLLAAAALKGRPPTTPPLPAPLVPLAEQSYAAAL